MLTIRAQGEIASECAIRPFRRRSAGERLIRQDAAAARVLTLVGDSRGIPVDLLLHRSRGRAEAAAARQLAMYLVHVMLGRSLTEVGALFGRDRTTVAHACALIEDQRDDRGFDEDVTRLEAAIDSAADEQASADAAA